MRCRGRRTCKWGGAVIVMLLVLVWAGSAWWACTTFPKNWCCIGAGSGAFFVFIDRDRSSTSSYEWMYFFRRDESFRWWWDASGFQPKQPTVYVYIPIWWVILPMAIATGWLWRRDRRCEPEVCTNCGYDLRGADHQICPECGAVVKQANCVSRAVG